MKILNDNTVLKVNIDKNYLKKDEAIKNTNIIKYSSINKLNNGISVESINRGISEDNPIKHSKELDRHIKHAMNAVNNILNSYNDEDLERLTKSKFDIGKMSVSLLEQVGNSKSINKKIGLDENNKFKIDVDDDMISSLLEIYSEEDILNNGRNAKNKEKQLNVKGSIAEKVDKIKDILKGENKTAKIKEEDIEKVLEKLKENDMDIDEKVVKELLGFMDKIDRIRTFSSNELISFLNSKKDATVNNIFEFSNSNIELKDKLSEEELEDITKDIKKLINKNFNEEEQEVAEKISENLIKKGIELNEKTMSVLKLVLGKEDYLKEACDSLKRCKVAGDFNISKEEALPAIMSKIEINNIMQGFENITNNSIKNAILNNKSLTYSNLINIQENQLQNENINNLEIEKGIEDLNIIKYQMSTRALMNLSIKGMDIKNIKLSKLRTSLNEEYGNISKKANEVSEVIKQLSRINSSYTKTISIAAISSENILKEDANSNITINKLADIAKNYENNMTEIRKDLGDSIEKSFESIADIMQNESIKNTKQNERAIEIIARSGLEISKENIEKVKFVDTSMQIINESLRPEYIKQLIENNIECLNIPIENLAAFVKEKDEDIMKDISYEIAKGIIELEKKGIEDEKRESIVGFYKMLSTINKSKGAAIGYLLQNDMDVNLENLYDAANYLRRKGSVSEVNNNSLLDKKIDDNFGMLEELNKKGKSIKNEILSGYNNKENDLDEITKIAIHKLDDKNQEAKEALIDFSKIPEDIIKNGLLIKEDITIDEWKSLKELAKNPQIFRDGMEKVIKDMDDKTRESVITNMQEFLKNPTKNGFEHWNDNIKKTLANHNSKDIRDFKNHLSLQEAFTKKENYLTIPIMINGEISQMNMYYIEKQEEILEEDTSVYFNFNTKNLGETNFKLTFDDENVSVKISGKDELKNLKEEFMKIFEELDFKVTDFEYKNFEIPKPFITHENMKNRLNKKYNDSNYESLV